MTLFSSFLVVGILMSAFALFEFESGDTHSLDGGAEILFTIIQSVTGFSGPILIFMGVLGLVIN